MKLKQRVEQMTSCLLALRRMQDKSEADFISSLGALSLPQLNVLNIIGDTQPCTMGEIAKRALLSLSSVTLIVDKLTKANLVIRARSDSDRRIVYATLAPEGQTIYQVQIEHLQFVGNRMLSMLAEQEQEVLIKALQKLTTEGRSVA